MKEEFCERKERLLYELLAIWSGAFVWKLHGEESAILTISTCPLVSDRSCFSSDFETFKETLRLAAWIFVKFYCLQLTKAFWFSALHMLGELTKKLKLFASALLQHFCFPLIRTKVVKFEAKLEEQQKSAKLLIEKEQPKDQRKGLPSSKEVLVGLEDLFNTLK